MAVMQDRGLKEVETRPVPVRQPMNAESARLHIQQLVLEGLSPLDEARIRAAVQRELTRLFLVGGVPRRSDGSEVADGNSGESNVAWESDAKRIGAEIARAVYGELTR